MNYADPVRSCVWMLAWWQATCGSTVSSNTFQELLAVMGDGYVKLLFRARTLTSPVPKYQKQNIAILYEFVLHCVVQVHPIDAIEKQILLVGMNPLFQTNLFLNIFQSILHI